MSSHPEPSPQEVLAGLVERVTYHNAENGFCVLRARARGHRDVVTVVGHAASISAGEWITASGDWVNDRTHGQQFKARFLRTSPPTSADGIEKYLSSGMIRGVGPVYAKKLVRAFGDKVFDIIEATPDRLREVDGIGPVRAASILAAWAEQKAVREIMVFLHSHGVSTARAVRIFKTYGSDAIQVMSENPYRLARDIRGIGFKTADAIAMKLGIEKTALIRVRAGISYALTEAMDEGHCGLPTYTALGGPALSTGDSRCSDVAVFAKASASRIAKCLPPEWWPQSGLPSHESFRRHSSRSETCELILTVDLAWTRGLPVRALAIFRFAKPGFARRWDRLRDRSFPEPGWVRARTHPERLQDRRRSSRLVRPAQPASFASLSSARSASRISSTETARPRPGCIAASAALRRHRRPRPERQEWPASR